MPGECLEERVPPDGQKVGVVDRDDGRRAGHVPEQRDLPERTARPELAGVAAVRGDADAPVDDDVEAIARVPFPDDPRSRDGDHVLGGCGEPFDDRSGERRKHRDGTDRRDVAEAPRIDAVSAEQGRGDEGGDQREPDPQDDEGAAGTGDHDEQRDEEAPDRLGSRLE